MTVLFSATSYSVSFPPSVTSSLPSSTLCPTSMSGLDSLFSPAWSSTSVSPILISNWDQYYQINHWFHWNKFNCDLETTEDKQLYFLLSSHFWIVSKASIKAHIPKPWPSNTVWCEGGRCMPMCLFIIVVWSAGLACNLQMALLCVITQSNLTDIFLDSLCLKFVWRQVLKSTQTETKTRPVPVLWCMTDSC